MYVSDCCGAEPRGNGDSDTSDIGICPDCGDHCEYIDTEEEEEKEERDFSPEQEKIMEIIREDDEKHNN